MATARSRTSDFVALTKPRLNLLVVATTAGGYYLGAGPGANLLSLANVTLATALVAGGSAAFNQVMERRVDALMERTRRRPVAEGRLAPRESLLFAAALSLAGLLWLALTTTVLATVVAFVTLLTYVVLYTPLKQRTSFSTVVGAIPGALPPMIGWAAATDTLSREAWVLFAIIFLWQMPHFLAIAWLFKDDYGRAGFPMLPVLEPDGRSTGYHVAAYASALLPVSLVPSLMGLAGFVYFGVALALGLAFLAVSLRFAVSRTRRDARVLFFTSIAYLPLVWLAMVLDRLCRPPRSAGRTSGVVAGPLRKMVVWTTPESSPSPLRRSVPLHHSGVVRGSLRACRAGISARSRRHFASSAAQDATIAAGSSPARMRAVVASTPIRRSSGLS